MPADWLNHLGLPAGAVGIAVAIYGAPVAAENAASKQRALKEISRLLLNTGIERSANAQGAAFAIFQATFGKTHFSIRCLGASIFATALLAPVILYLTSAHNSVPVLISLFTFFPVRGLMFVATVIISDYLALLKTRFFLSFGLKSFGANHPLTLVLNTIADIASLR